MAARKTPANKTSTTAAASPEADESVGADGTPYVPPTDDEGTASAPNSPSGGAQRWSPVDAGAERAVVASVLVAPEVLDDLVEVIDSEDFADPVAAAVFNAMVTCHGAGRPVDQITVADQLRAAKMLDKVGGIDGLADLAASGISVENVMAHADIVADKAQLRRVIGAGREMATDAMKPGADGISVRQNAERIVFELGRERGRSSLQVLAEGIPKALAEITMSRTTTLLGDSTGLTDLDKLIGGLQNGHLITLAARPAVGKSALALGIAKHFTETTGKSAAVLTWEMTANELMLRMLAEELRYDSRRLLEGDLPPGMDLDLAHAAEKLAGLPLYIDDNPPSTIGGVRSAMRRLARRTSLGLVVVDYMQLMESERRNRGDMNRTEEVSEISRGLKRLAGELDCPILGLSQLSRAVEQRPNKRPVLSDLRESGCLTRTTRLLRADTNTEVTIGELFDSGERNIPVWSVDADGKMVRSTLTHAFSSGVKKVFRVRSGSGLEVEATANHPFLTLNGWVPLGDLAAGSQVAVPRTLEAPTSEGIDWTGCVVAWDEIASIEELGDEEVFDATVLKTHNFVANGFVLHNSIEQDSNIVMFLYRDHLYNANADPAAAEIIIAKQRSGPTGTVHVEFDGPSTSFRNRPGGSGGYSYSSAPPSAPQNQQRGGGDNRW